MDNRRKALLKPITVFVAALILVTPGFARADRAKITVALGNYNYTTSSGSASGFASYALSYSYDAFRKFQVFGGATMTLAKFITGQTGFGIDFGGRYYPFTDCGVVVEEMQETRVVSWAMWRPFVGLAFRQRTFAATSQATYMGIGLLGGVDRQLSERFSLSFQANYDKLSGPGSSTATQINALFGGSVHF